MTERTYTTAEALGLAEQACLAAGAGAESARTLARVTVAAASGGRKNVGFPHLLDYLSAYRSGRINPDPAPGLTLPLPAILQSDADGGIAQLGFDRAAPTLIDRAHELGVALFTQRNSFTTGELGYYARHLAEAGLITLAVSNSPAVLASQPGSRAVFGTNPMAFAAPLIAGRPPLLIDQASSVTALVNLTQAAASGQAIPDHWAIDASGAATRDPVAALRGALLAFGGAKGANIALMVECLAAGLSGAAWSLDMPQGGEAASSVDAGLTIIAIQPDALDPDFASRLTRQLDRLSEQGAYIPGQRAPATHEVPDEIAIETSVLERMAPS
ncbi:Ldh family oxidoreductase [Halomonas halmophila]|uniref:Malate dehydrogenase n=1 Tax=Halomonas halmophila TaxID=252 RepID=A0A4Y4F111_9GAMM|nr:Ldh family oxidoreductase [Halomonas halmophila]GED23076.1 malate dehydrogenase [Halomonas halmophila]